MSFALHQRDRKIQEAYKSEPRDFSLTSLVRKDWMHSFYFRCHLWYQKGDILKVRARGMNLPTPHFSEFPNMKNFQTWNFQTVNFTMVAKYDFQIMQTKNSVPVLSEISFWIVLTFIIDSIFLMIGVPNWWFALLHYAISQIQQFIPVYLSSH